MSRASELFAKARAALLVGAPFWGVLSLRLAPLEDSTISTMQTDGVSIRFNPDFVTGLSRAVLRTAIGHETMHCAALHHTRRGNRDARRWNIACDYAINPLLAETGFEMPEGVLLDPAYAGMSAEEIYDKLPHDAGDDGDDQDSDDPGGMGGVTDPPAGGASISDAGASRQPNPPGQSGIRVPSRADLARQEESWAIATAQAEATAKAMGISAGDAARAIREQVTPRVDWRDVLRRYLSAAARSDYAWTPPEPALYRPRALSAVAAQRNPRPCRRRCRHQRQHRRCDARRLLRPRSPPSWTRRRRRRSMSFYCDAGVRATESFEPGDAIDLSPQGGGGTAFRPVFDWIARSDIQPVCAIYLTDLDGDDFGPEPDYPVLWVSTESTARRSAR